MRQRSLAEPCALIALGIRLSNERRLQMGGAYSAGALTNIDSHATPSAGCAPGQAFEHLKEFRIGCLPVPSLEIFEIFPHDPVGVAHGLWHGHLRDDAVREDGAVRFGSSGRRIARGAGAGWFATEWVIWFMLAFLTRQADAPGSESRPPGRA
jgi:hypothetical protein